MKKNSLFLVITFMTIAVSGCAENGNKRTGDSRAYLSDGNGENDAVNTLQSGSKYKIAGPMDDLKDAVADIIGENYWPDTLLSSEELAERTGISENMYEDFLAEYQHTEAGIDMMILVKAREEEIGTIEKFLNEYRNVLLKIYEQQEQNKAKVSASRIETIGNYVCYVQLGADISSLENIGTDRMVEHCLQENERALDILEKRILSSL